MRTQKKRRRQRPVMHAALTGSLAPPCLPVGGGRADSARHERRRLTDTSGGRRYRFAPGYYS